jgi:hypothetical protein
MSKRAAPLTFVDTPSISAARRRTSSDSAADGIDMEMLSARIKGVNARQFRAYAKLKGTTVQAILDEAITEYLERHRF